MKKKIRLTEQDLVNLIKKIIVEQKVKTITIVTPGENAEGEIVITKDGRKKLKVKTENQEQEIFVKTALPQGKFMFEMGSDGKLMYGYEPKTRKKLSISPEGLMK